MASTLDQLCRLLRGQTAPRPDWEKIIALANRALITPRLEGRLPAKAPQDAVRFVGEVARRNRDRNGRLLGQLGEAAAALNATGLIPLVLKGGACLARSGGLCPRVIGDIDLVVAPRHIDQALGALQAAGFEILTRSEGMDRHAVATLGRGQDVGEIDLHQRPPGPPSFVGGLEISEGGQGLEVGAGRLRVPAPHLHIYLQALHDQLHDGRYWRGGFDLRHAWDIADLIAGEEGVDWESLASLAPTRLTRHALEAQLAACRRLTGAAIPVTMTGWTARLQARRQGLQAEAPWLGPPLAALAMLSQAGDFREHWRSDRLGRAKAGLPPPGRDPGRLFQALFGRSG